MVGDVDALQGLYLRGIGPPLVAVVVAAGVRRRRRASSCLLAGAILAAGLLVAGVALPALAARLGSSAGRRQAAARGELTAELVELLRGAPELVVYGREEEKLARGQGGRRASSRASRAATRSSRGSPTASPCS